MTFSVKGKAKCSECTYEKYVEEDSYMRCIDRVQHLAALHEHVTTHRVKQYICFE